MKDVIINKVFDLFFGKESKKVPIRKIARINQKINTFVKILQELTNLSESSTLRVGCIILKKDFSKFIYGYNGSYRGAPINPLTGTEEESIEPGHSGFLHAEQNAIAKFNEINPEDWIVIVSTSPCNLCMKLLINVGFKHIYWIEEYRETTHLNVLKNLGINHGDINQLKNDYLNIAT